MQAKFDKFGAECFEDHELLEMLLYFSIPRIDTNLLAHRLIDRFGSLGGVLDADINELRSVEGIGEKSAFLIKLTAATTGRYIQNENEIKNAFTDIDEVGRHLVGVFAGESCEKLYLIILDKKGRETDRVHIASGSMERLEFSAKQIIDIAIRSGSSNVILAHNHPGGYARPSKNDTDMTYRVRDTLSKVGIKLIEHFVVSGNQYYPIILNSDIYR